VSQTATPALARPIPEVLVPDQALSPAMAARYGVGRTSPVGVAAVAVLVLGFLAVIGAITWRMATPPVQAKVLAYDVVTDSAVDVTFEVRRDELSDTVCVLRAQSAKHVDVGYATVTISRGRTYVQPRHTIATLARATTVELLGCAPNEAPVVDPPAFAPGTTNPPQISTIDGA
jgi:hypothetical protein